MTKLDIYPMTPTGYTHLTNSERLRIITLRDAGYSLKQISQITGRGGGTVRRILYKSI